MNSYKFKSTEYVARDRFPRSRRVITLRCIKSRARILWYVDQLNIFSLSGMAKYTKYIAIDFGTSGCTISLGFVEPNPNKILVYTAWSELKKAVDVKCPSILLVNPSKYFENFGEEAFKAYSKLSKDDAKKYYYFYRFKMKLYRTPVSLIVVLTM